MHYCTDNIARPELFAHSILQEVIMQDINPAYRNADPNVFETTEAFWDCECDGRVRGYIRPAFIEKCPHCGASRSECPDSRINELMIQLTCNPYAWC